MEVEKSESDDSDTDVALVCRLSNVLEVIPRLLLLLLLLLLPTALVLLLVLPAPIDVVEELRSMLLSV